VTRQNLKDHIKEGLLLLDGAMGTQLIAHGATGGLCSDYLNIESPDVVLEVHKAYIEAGSDAVLTNTFGANRYALARHGHADKVREINRVAAEIARRAAGNDKYVLGDIGPSGDFLEPVGMLLPDDLKDAFTNQAKALIDTGVDGIIIETMTALDEVEIALIAAKSVAGNLPVFASMSFEKRGDDFKTMMGVDVTSAVSKLLSLGADAVGFNCGSASLDEYIELAESYADALSKISGDVPLLAEPNAGKPELIDGEAVYRVTPQQFAAAAQKIHAAGFNIIGGCCGTTSQHIAALAQKLK